MHDILLTLKEEYNLVEETIGKLGNEVAELETKLTETRARQKALVMRREAAGNRLDVRRQLDTGRTDEAMAKFEQYERRIDELEAEADSLSIGKGKRLEDEFADLQAQDDIEKELARMKAELKDKE